MDDDIVLNQAFEDQQDMSAVEKFSFKHDFQQLPADMNTYKELIPKKTPGLGQQYAFEVNLDQCSGCKACVVACHNENGLEEDETWRSVGLVHGVTTEGPVIQHVTGACHHCIEPACMHGCPVKAYEKDPDTGVVKHLDDQCIGCQYCILKCPYDVPKYNKKKGIVHKCDMCISRLKVGEAPACVRACPSEAIRINIVDKVVVQVAPEEFVKIPQAPDTRYTLPTTRYVTTKELLPTMTSINEAMFKPEHSHMPLVVMLVLTQLSVGTFLVEWIVNRFVDGSLRAMFLPVHVWSALGVGLLALGSSILHLGRPQYAFRAILGFKTSWLSREIVAFGVFAFLALVYAMSTKQTLSSDIWAGAVLFSGLLAVMASVMVYRDTHRVLWDTPLTTFKFFMTVVILGAMAVMTVSLSAGYFFNSVPYAMQALGTPLAKVIVGLSLLKLIVEASLFSHLRQPELTPLKKSALLMTGALQYWTMQRFIYGILGGIVLPLGLVAMQQYLSPACVIAWAWGIALLTMAGELMERYLFFRAVIPLRMPT